MKIALPLITLVLCALFLVTQQISLSRAEEKNEDLDTRIKEVQLAQSNGARQDSPSGKSSRSGPHRTRKEANDNIPDSVAEITEILKSL